MIAAALFIGDDFWKYECHGAPARAHRLRAIEIVDVIEIAHAAWRPDGRAFLVVDTTGKLTVHYAQKYFEELGYVAREGAGARG